MQEQGFEGAQPPQREQAKTRNLAGAASYAYERTTELGGEMAEQARAAAAGAAAAAGSQVRSVLDRQVGVAAMMAGDVAHSFEVAAEELDRSAPLAADLVRGAADRIAGYADGLQDQSADDLLQSAADFTRRQPALVFGLAALAGFFVFRAVKNTPSPVRAPSLQPSQDSDEDDLSDNLGNVRRPRRKRTTKRRRDGA
jgi:hypothetical protein